MKKLLSLFLACILLLGILPTSVFAADSVEEALLYLAKWPCGHRSGKSKYRENDLSAIPLRHEPGRDC